MALTVRTVVFGLVFEYTVTVFLSSPSVSRFFGLNTTSILPFAPGMIGSFGQFGTVQPHEPFAFSINNGSVPVFTNSKAWLVFRLSFHPAKIDYIRSKFDVGQWSLRFIGIGAE